MRRLFGALISGLLALSLAGPASAVVLGSGGSLSLNIAFLDPIVIAGAGPVTVNGSGAAGHLTALKIPANRFSTNAFVVPITDPAAFPVRGLQLTAANGAANFTVAGAGGGGGFAGFGGVMPLFGQAKLCLFAACTGAVANVSVPLGPIGVGGNAFATGAVNVTVFGAPWTTGEAVVGSILMMGGVSPNSNTGAPSGNVTLVTPIFVSTNLSAGLDVIPTFGILKLHFVPELGTLTLLGSGVVALVAFGRRAGSRSRAA